MNGSRRPRRAQEIQPQQNLLGLDGAVGGHRFAVDLAQRLLQAPGLRAFQVRALQPVHRSDLIVGIIAQRRVHGFGLSAHFLALHLVHGGVGQGDHMKAVVADLDRRQAFAHAFGISGAHVH